MSSVIILEAFQAFLAEKVASGIKFQQARVNEVQKYELVNPQVHIGWIPPQGFLPPEMEYTIPCLVVGYDEDSDDGQEGSMNIRLSVAVYNPGKHEPDVNGIKYTPNMEGYRDLLNFIDRTKAELLRNRIINKTVTVQLPIKTGMYAQEQPYPFWYGWLTFSVRVKSGLYVESIAQQYL